jgi:uncharacterized protein (TIGR03067 family)
METPIENYNKPSKESCPRCNRPLQGSEVEGLCAFCLGALNFSVDSQYSYKSSSQQIEFSQQDLDESFPQLDVLEVLGRGGMGVVYKARQKELGRIVALKLLPPDRVAEPMFADRFRQEAQTLAALNHPNIVAIYDFGQVNGLFYLLMEFVDGVNLRQAMNAGRFTPAQALTIVPPVCDALQFAHEQGIVHRDIKPENLLLDKQGHVKIADFGIAKILGREAAATSMVNDPLPAGTPQYMAPEQMCSSETDHRADIYSLGVVLYEMLTGELPNAQWEPPSRRLQIDVRIDQIVLRALEAKPELRFGTATEFRTSVEEIVQTSEIQSSLDCQVEPHHFSRLALWGIALAMVCLLCLPFLDMAWIGGFGSSVLGWLSIREIQRSQDSIRGRWMAVLVGLLFPLLAVNVVMIAFYTKLISPIRNLPYPAMVNPTWPFLVIGFGMVTLLLIVLLDSIVAYAVWQRLIKSSTTSTMVNNPRRWRIAAGCVLAILGGTVLLGVPTVNELVEGFLLTKTARDNDRELRQASERWSDFATAAHEATTALDSAQGANDAAEVERLTKESQSLKERAAHAEFALNQVSLQMKASSRERSILLYVLGGGLIMFGLLTCSPVANRKRRTVHQSSATRFKTGMATLVTPKELASLWNQFFCYRTRGCLTLDAMALTHSYSEKTTAIPLKAIKDVSLGRLPRLMNLSGLNVLSVTYEDDGKHRQVLISPIEGWLEFSQAAVAEWFASIRNAVEAATGKAPSISPQEHLGIPKTSGRISAAFVAIALLLALVVVLKLSHEANRTSHPSQSHRDTMRGLPVSFHIHGNHHSVFVVQDDSNATLDYVLYFPGDMLASSSGTRNSADQTWVDEGIVKLRSGQNFAYSRSSLSPEELQINGEHFDLRSGRVIALQVDGRSQQLRAFPSLGTARDPEAIGRLVADDHPLQESGVVAYRISRVEVPEGTRNLSLELQREWQNVPFLGIESSLHVVAGTSVDPSKRMPKNGSWVTRKNAIALSADQLTLAFELPEELPIGSLREAATKIQNRHMDNSGIPGQSWLQTLSENRPNRLAAIVHPDGWECHLFVRAVRLDEMNRPIEASNAISESAAQDDTAPAATPADPNSILTVRSYDFGFAFTGTGTNTRLRDDVRLVIDQFVQKVDAESGRTPDVSMDPRSHILTLSGPPEQQREMAEMIVNLKKHAAQETSPITAWGEERDGLQLGLGYRPGENRVYHPGETVTLVVRLKNLRKDKVTYSYRPDLFYKYPLNVTDGDDKPVVFEGLPEPLKCHQRRLEVELTPGEMDLCELKLTVRSASEAGTQRPAWTIFGIGKFQLSYPKTGKLKLEVEEPEIKTAFTAWGNELGGLQAGIGFRASNQGRVYHPGDKVSLVVRVRNVEKHPILFRHLSHYFLSSPPVIKDRSETTITLRGESFSGKPHLIAHELEPDREIELAELTIDILPSSVQITDKTWAVRDLGTYRVRYEQIEGVIGPGNGVPDALLGYMLDTGTLEFEVQKAEAPSILASRPIVTNHLEPTFLTQAETTRVNVIAQDNHQTNRTHKPRNLTLTRPGALLEFEKNSSWIPPRSGDVKRSRLICIADDGNKPCECGTNEAYKTEVARLQGEWRVVGWEEEGFAADPATWKNKKFVIRGSDIEGELRLATKTQFELNLAKEPKEMDLTALDGWLKGRTEPGIYETDGQRLRICFGSKTRPTEFATTPVSGLLLMTLESGESKGAEQEFQTGHELDHLRSLPKR